MIDWFVGYALRKRLVVAMTCVFVAIFGYYSWTQLAIEAYPDIADTSAQVVTQAPGMAAEEVEQQITIPLERQLNGTPGLLFMRSKSTFGLSLITVTFREGVEDYWSRQRLIERIQSATLPPNLTPGLDPQQLLRFGLSLANVEAAITANSSSSGGSVVTRGELGYVVRGIGLVQTLDDMGSIVVTQRNGTPILLRDLGKLKLGNAERHGVLGESQKSDGIEGTVLLLKGDNASRVLDDVHAKVNELNARLKADDVQIVPYIDRADLVDATVDKVSHTIIQGIGLVFIVLLLFLGSPRGAMIVGITIPFALVAAFIAMHLTGISANLLSLVAIVFGIIVDGAIVMTEAILRRREAKPDEPLTEADAREAATQVARPIFFATLIIITAYLPLFAFQRVEAKLFYPMVYTVGFAQLGALAFALLVVPGLAFAAYRRPRHIFRNRALAWIERNYQAALAGSLRRPNVAYVASVGAAVAIVVLGLAVWREFLPTLDEGAIWLHAELPPGISLQKATEMVAELRRELDSFPEMS